VQIAIYSIPVLQGRTDPVLGTQRVRFSGANKKSEQNFAGVWAFGALGLVSAELRPSDTSSLGRRKRKIRRPPDASFEAVTMRAFALALSLLFICHTCQSASALVQNVDSTPEVENRFFLDIVAFVHAPNKNVHWEKYRTRICYLFWTLDIFSTCSRGQLLTHILLF
jgi:hypothetical protein